MSSGEEYVKVKFECEDNNSNFSNSFTQDEEQCDTSQTGELFNIKTIEGGTMPISLRAGNRLLFGSGKYFCIEHTTAYTDYQKENTGIVCICHSCGTRIKGSLKVSSNFICHLKNKHPELYQGFLKQKSEYSAANARAAKRASLPSHRSSPYQVPASMLNNSLHNNEKQEQFHHNILKFLIATSQSYNVVQAPSFVKLFEFLDFPVLMRAPDYYEQVVKDACEYKKLELYHTFNNCRAYVCNSIDAWSYAGIIYVAIACHWIDDRYQRQSTILTCRRAKNLDMLGNIQSEVLQRNGIVAENITASPTGNLQSFQKDFIEFGVLKEVFAQEFSFISDENMANLEYIELTYQHLVTLDIQKLTKIWGHNFVRKLSDSLQIVHKSVMEKCSSFWIASLSKDFQTIFQSILNEPITIPQISSLVSLYHAIKQVLSHADKLDHIFSLLHKPGFTPMELKYLAELQEVFEPLSAAFAFLDMQQNHYYGCFLPTLVTLKWKLTRLYNGNRLVHLHETLTALKEELLDEFKDYYDLDENKSEAILAALTYPPVKTRFIMGLNDHAPAFKFQPQHILRKYGSEYHVVLDDQKPVVAPNHNYGPNSQNHMARSTTSSSDFFDFGDTAVDAEELRDVNISKKELTELMTELFGDLNEGLSFESIELETPRKFLLSCQDDRLNTPNTSPERLEENPEASRQLHFLEQPQQPEPVSQSLSSCAVTSSNITQHDMSFHPDVMSTPSIHNNNKQHADCGNVTLIPVALPNENQNEACSPGSTVAIPSANLNSEVEFIALPIPGQPNHFQLAKIVNSDDNPLTPRKQPIEAPTVSSIEELGPKPDLRYDRPYETNYSAFYISLKRHAYSEFKEKFEENLKQAQVNQISSTTSDAELGGNNASGFTKYQYDLLQQQMRIHVQMLSQTYVQTYCHPTLWNLAKKPKEMLMELQTKAQSNNNFKIWNLEKAISLIEKWQKELDEDTEANRQLMAFMHREIELTNHNTRQIPRFHPRILECFLQSNVFMYPEYLPRMPFSSKVMQFETFSPVESYLIAMGLEKHMKIITEKKERIPGKSTPLRVACKRLTKDTIRGKSCRIVWNYIMRFKNADYYNPIKYFFDHDKAPPVEYTPIIGFENNTVLPPKDRVDELPLVFQKYLEAKNAPPREKKPRRKSSTQPRVKASEKFRNSFLQFVREAVGEDIITLPDNCEEAAQPDASASVGSNDSETAIIAAKKRKSPKDEAKSKRRVPENLTINVNYMFGAGPINTTNYVTPPVHNISAAVPPPLVWWNTSNSEASLSASNNTTKISAPSQSLQETSVNQSVDSSLSLLAGNCATGVSEPIDDTADIAFNFDLTTQTLKPCKLHRTQNRTEVTTHNSNSSEAKSTTDLIEHQEPDRSQNADQKEIIKLATGNKKSQVKKTRIFSNICKLNRHTRRKAVAYREKRRIKQRCEDLITAYGSYLETLQLRFQHAPTIQRYYRKFKALDMYTNLLTTLREICSKKVLSQHLEASSLAQVAMTSSGNSPGSLKRARNASTEDESSPSSQRMARKINRQEENFRHMLLPDTPKETNRKDAIYAFNFYEKVEEAFRSSNRPDDCKKFNAILKSFDPKNDKVSELYYKLEKLFLPDHPELAQVFLTFILPSEAAEIGKFFEHFMINNMATFITKLNIYFNNQPAQIRKIYNCLNELADDPDVSMEKLEAKIVPLLKGNQFLIDWFMQQFPQNAPPERLLGNPEHVLNLKEQQANRTGEYVETLTDLLDSPTNDNQMQQTCQLRYINGRIFYGTKMLLPAKLSFMASSYKNNCVSTQITSAPPMPATTCVHAIKEHGEKRLQAATELVTVTPITECNDDHERSEEDDVSKQLVIDTTAEEDDSCSSIEACDENTLKAHALRLNPSYYSSSCYSSNATSTPNLNSNLQTHHPNAKKTSLNFNEPEGAAGSTIAGKTSPRKHTNHQTSQSPSLSNPTCPSSMSTKEKRKSPSKKSRSPSNNTAARSVRTCNQPMVVIHETSSAIQCAKRLKTLVESSESNEESLDTKEHINIIARTKSSMKPIVNNCNLSSITVSVVGSIKNPEEVKQENSDDLEFLPENPSVTRSPFPSLKIDTDSNEEDGGVTKSVTPKPTTDSQSNTTISITEPGKSNETPTTTVPLNAAWTRDEDKIILIEMKLGSQNREELFQRIAEKMPQRTMCEITERHQFLMDFLSKLQRK